MGAVDDEGDEIVALEWLEKLLEFGEVVGGREDEDVEREWQGFGVLVEALVCAEELQDAAIPEQVLETVDTRRAAF